MPSLRAVRATLAGLCAASLLAAACASGPSGPPPTLSCPAPLSVVSPNGNPVAASFQAPVASSSPPATAVCTPASGSLFPIGATSVSCSAAVLGGSVSCSFTVTVSPPPRLERTRSLAFGDSITFGASDLCAGGSSTSGFWTPAELFLPWADPPATSYPSVLQTLLRERYTAQLPLVVNAGVGGEYVTESATRQRFTRALSEHAPEIVLLQEGINDLHALEFYKIPPSQGAALVRDALRAFSLEARGRGAQVFLATLLPQRPNGCRAFAIPPRGNVDLITPTNALIRSMAAAENIDLVDLAALFQNQVSTLIGQDGLHPNEAGRAAIAKAFFDAIRQKLERPF